MLATGGGSTTSHGGGVDDESREGEALLSSPPSIELALTSYATLSVSWTTTTRAAVAANRPSSDSTSSSSLGGGNGGGGGGLEQAFDVSAKELAREDHARLRHEMLAQLEQLRNDGTCSHVLCSLDSWQQRKLMSGFRAQDTPFLAFALANALRDWLAEAGIEPRASDEQAHGRQGAHGQHQQRVRGPLHLKLALLWSHHLLATSKRRDIVAWASELDLYVISKPGYPGVIVTEGIERDVDEFLTRIKVRASTCTPRRSPRFSPLRERGAGIAVEGIAGALRGMWATYRVPFKCGGRALVRAGTMQARERRRPCC